MKIYTRTGDKGETSLLFGKRASKAEQIFDVLGTLDELNASISIYLSEVEKLKSPKYTKQIKKLKSELEIIQNKLFEIGSMVANPKFKPTDAQYLLTEVKTLEETMDVFDTLLPELKNFVMPGGALASSVGHLSRAITRRLERGLVKLTSTNKSKFAHIIVYINRLSDFLFVSARFCNLTQKRKDILWIKNLR